MTNAKIEEEENKGVEIQMFLKIIAILAFFFIMGIVFSTLSAVMCDDLFEYHKTECFISNATVETVYYTGDCSSGTNNYFITLTAQFTDNNQQITSNVCATGLNCLNSNTNGCSAQSCNSTVGVCEPFISTSLSNNYYLSLNQTTVNCWFTTPSSSISPTVNSTDDTKIYGVYISKPPCINFWLVLFLFVSVACFALAVIISLWLSFVVFSIQRKSSLPLNELFYWKKSNNDESNRFEGEYEPLSASDHSPQQPYHQNINS